MFTMESLKQVLDYDPETGIFTRLKHRGKNTGTVFVGKNGYRSYGVKHKRYLAHRLAWFFVYGAWPEKLVDHINGDKLDNRICNLRACDKSGNGANAKRVRLDKLKGVFKQGRRYRVRMGVRGKSVHGGYFDTEEEAHRRYCQLAVEHFGEFARFS